MCRKGTKRVIHIFESLDEVREQFSIYSWALVKSLIGFGYRISMNFTFI